MSCKVLATFVNTVEGLPATMLCGLNATTLDGLPVATIFDGLPAATTLDGLTGATTLDGLPVATTLDGLPAATTLDGLPTTMMNGLPTAGSPSNVVAGSPSPLDGLPTDLTAVSLSSVLDLSLLLLFDFLQCFHLGMVLHLKIERKCHV